MMTHQPRRPRRDDDRDDYREQPSRRRKQNMLDRIPLDWMLTLGSIVVIVEACRQVSIVSYLLVTAWMTLSAVVLFYTDKDKNLMQSNLRKFFKNYGRTGLLGVLFATVALTSLFFALSEPSYAVFLDTVQTKIIDALTVGPPAASATTKTAITGIVSLVINVIRVVLAIAIIFGVVKAIQSRDDQEQVKAQLTLPFIIIIGVAIIDLAATVIFA